MEREGERGRERGEGYRNRLQLRLLYTRHGRCASLVIKKLNATQCRAKMNGPKVVIIGIEWIS